MKQTKNSTAERVLTRPARIREELLDMRCELSVLKARAESCTAQVTAAGSGGASRGRENAVLAYTSRLNDYDDALRRLSQAEKEAAELINAVADPGQRLILTLAYQDGLALDELTKYLCANGMPISRTNVFRRRAGAVAAADAVLALRRGGTMQ